MARNKRIYTREDVETRSGHPCVNVKVYGSTRSVKLPMCLCGSRPADQPDTPIVWEYTDPEFTHAWIEEHSNDSQADGAFALACESGWETIHEDAREIFGVHVKVYSEGRSGGWAVVHGLPDIDTWDAIMLGKWRKFERYAKLTASDVPRLMVDDFYFNNFLTREVAIDT